MSTVGEIAARIVREERESGRLAPDPTEQISAVPGRQHKQWEPNRKVLASAVAGLVTVVGAFVSQGLGIELNEATTSSLTAGLMLAASYVVPERH